jgi:putrescine aminotransferase
VAPVHTMSDTPHDELAALTFRRYEQYVNPGMAALVGFMGFETVEVAAEGCYVYGSDGRRFLDFLGGPGVFTMGHRHPRIVAAVQEQAARMPLGSHLLLNPVQAQLCERLAGLTPGALQYTFMCNSGAEAVEGALKVARAFTGRPGFVATTGAFHGKTFGALSASGRETYRKPFEPLLAGFTHVPFGDAEALAQAVGPDTAAVIIEPIQCEAGIRIPPDGYLRAAREACDSHGALLILDEVQTGLGRTGRMFACDWEGVAPDIMALGKALGGGVMPIGAFTARPEVWSIFEENPLLHSSTFGGNPLACAAALAALDVLEEEGLVERAAARGDQLLDGVAALALRFPGLIQDVRGRGLLVGVEFTDADVGGLVIAGLSQRDVLAAYALNNPEVLRLEPPAVISEAQIAQAVEALEGALSQTAALLEG